MALLDRGESWQPDPVTPGIDYLIRRTSNEQSGFASVQGHYGREVIHVRSLNQTWDPKRRTVYPTICCLNIAVNEH